MSIYYDEILAGNCFGQINVTTPGVKKTNTDSEMSSPTNGSTSELPSTSDGAVIDNSSSKSLPEEFGFSTSNLFQKARQFVKEKEGSKAIHLSYRDKLHLVALSKQATIGKWNAEHTQQVGFLDVIGNDRKQAWIQLGDMSKETAMDEYINMLLQRCPIFRPYLEAHHTDSEEKDRARKEDEVRHVLEQEAERARQYEIEQVSRIEEQKKRREELQRKQIQDALNQQTYPQFKAYAEQQYRDNRQAQDELIRQLQEQHFQQYMQQIYQQQLFHQQQLRTKANMEQSQQQPPLPQPNVEQAPPPSSSAAILAFPAAPSISQVPPLGPAPTHLPPLVNPPSQPVTNGNVSTNEPKVEPVPIQTQFESLNLNTPLHPVVLNELPQTIDLSTVQTNNELTGATKESVDGTSAVEQSVADGEAASSEVALSSDEATREYPAILPANMWTRKDIKEFKEHVRKEKDAVIKIGSGETVTVRVPTHEDGRCIFWEFGTDYYDIGFGLYFEWSKAQSNTVTVHVSDSSDEEEENEDGTNPEKKDIEKGNNSSNKPAKPYQDEIIPIFRRDCHEEVYAGSHPYPGHGVYLLKFDNSYSLWRSKTLYYRVYYSR